MVLKFRCQIVRHILLFLIANYCPALQAPANGRINGFRSELDATVGIACDCGYTAHGTSFRACQNSGQWSGSDPTCEREYSYKLEMQHSLIISWF